MQRKKVLLIGEHPFASSGNSGMMQGILATIDHQKYHVTCFAVETTGADPVIMADSVFPFAIVPASEGGDSWGKNKLINILQRTKWDAVIMVGIDIWRYKDVLNQIASIRNNQGFKWGGVLPYDLQFIRQDWAEWISLLDFPNIYSKYGTELLKSIVPKVEYFRPELHYRGFWQPYSFGDKRKARNRLYGNPLDDNIVFGFVGNNQIRKDPQRLLKAFSLVHKELPTAILYLHTELTKGVYNLKQYAIDVGLKTGSLRAKPENINYPPPDMVGIFNSFDVFVNCSMQEGLSWTPLEAMLCGVPVIASETTAQTELVEGAARMVKCPELGYIPMETKTGSSWVEAKHCNVEDIAEAMLIVGKDFELRKKMSMKSLEVGRKWLEEISDINALVEKMCAHKKVIDVKERSKDILFVQHSSGGDVLMSTQCFKGIKERHKGKKLVYMTQAQYKGIVEGNPYIDELLEWQPELLRGKYEVVYNPHGDKILPGGWNNLDVTLYSLYPYFCKVEPDKMYIKPLKPEIELPEEYLVVNTGGASDYRKYEHSALAFKGLNYPIVQLGGLGEPLCEGVIDMRNKLTWRESAWVMKHGKVALTVDSFCSHLAGCVGTPQVALFGPAPARVTRPRCESIENLICMEPNMLDVCAIVSHCWGNPPAGRAKCTTPCINTINPYKVRKNLQLLLERGKQS